MGGTLKFGQPRAVSLKKIVLNLPCFLLSLFIFILRSVCVITLLSLVITPSGAEPPRLLFFVPVSSSFLVSQLVL